MARQCLNQTGYSCTDRVIALGANPTAGPAYPQKSAGQASASRIHPNSARPGPSPQGNIPARPVTPLSRAHPTRKSLRSCLLTRRLNVQNQQKNRRYQNKKNAGYKTKLIDFHQCLPLLSTQQHNAGILVPNRLSLSPQSQAPRPHLFNSPNSRHFKNITLIDEKVAPRPSQPAPARRS